MKLWPYTLQLSIFVLSGVILLVLTGQSWASSPKVIRPAWSNTSNAQSQTNHSYLSQTGLIHNETLSDELFTDERMSCAIKTDAERRIDTYENKKNYGLTSPVDDQNHAREMKGVTQSAFMEVGKLHARHTLKKMRNFAEDAISGAREPIAVAVMAASLYTGQTMKFRVLDQKFEGHTAIRDKNASVSMLLPGLTSTVNYKTEDGVSASVSKSLDKNISAVVDTAAKGTVRLIYGVSF